ncbi:MAG: carboxypeptidase-like regulatory domain-containing protein [Chitinophagales bacterium]|nr:carboxypeptidase-like regulatory domain-containing protein [Chitinophagales bacterium]
MKTRKTIFPVMLLATIFSSVTAFAAIGGGNILGQVTNSETKEPVEFASVVLECQGVQKLYVTDEKGFYYASNIPAGVYTITVSFIGKTTQVKDVRINNDETREINISLGSSVTLEPKIVFGKKSEKPLLDKFDPTTKTLDKEDLAHAPVTRVTDIPALLNIPEMDGNYYVRGSRQGALAWYIDGCKITGDPNIPVCGVQLFRTYTNFLPAKYGDTNGGVVIIETRNWFTE